MKEEEFCNWYHGKMSRSSAENLLLEDNRCDGSFLVREGHSSSAGDFVLSVLYKNDVSHFQIKRHGGDAFFSLDESIKIHGLESLISYYVSTKTCLYENLSLTDPVNGEPPPPDSRRHGRTNLLHRATSEGNYNIVSELLKSGYRHEAKDVHGQTAVHFACINGKDDILRKLITYGANVNCRDARGNTPLHYACQGNWYSTVRLLVQSGQANVQARNTDTGDVPLHQAALNGHSDCIRELLSLNAPAQPRNTKNQTPAELAQLNGFNECANILMDYRQPPSKTILQEWYHGTLDRNEAQSLIRNYSVDDGTFLVRWSNRNQEPVITLICGNLFYNFIIRRQDQYLYIDNGPYLDSLEHVIEYYSNIADGLPTMLRTPVPPKPKPPIPEFSTMPRPKKKVSTLVKVFANSHQSNNLANQLESIKFETNVTPMKLTHHDDVQENYISIERLRFGTVIGVGEFGSVYEGTYTKPNGDVLNVAIKTLRNEHIDTNRGAFLAEANVMMKLNHSCIVKFIGISLGHPLLMVQELGALGSMLHYVIHHKEILSLLYDFKIWAAQIANGMKYLEEQRFVHRDLAARNILLASLTQVKISDFGLSRALGTNHEYYKAREGGKWPLKWYAPESYNYGTFSHKSDVWSYAVTLWEMYSFGESPYGNLNGPDAIELIEYGLRLEQPKSCPDNVYEWMKRCWEHDPNLRPTFDELFSVFSKDHDYINV